VGAPVFRPSTSRVKRPVKIRRIKGSKLTLSTSPNYREDGARSLRDTLHTLPTNDIVVCALLWIEDMEAIRARSSNFQGALSGRLR